MKTLLEMIKSFLKTFKTNFFANNLKIWQKFHGLNNIKYVIIIQEAYQMLSVFEGFNYRGGFLSKRLQKLESSNFVFRSFKLKSMT